MAAYERQLRRQMLFDEQLADLAGGNARHRRTAARCRCRRSGTPPHSTTTYTRHVAAPRATRTNRRSGGINGRPERFSSTANECAPLVLLTQRGNRRPARPRSHRSGVSHLSGHDVGASAPHGRWISRRVTCNT
jgi:hypothetical protein